MQIRRARQAISPLCRSSLSGGNLHYCNAIDVGLPLWLPGDLGGLGKGRISWHGLHPPYPPFPKEKWAIWRCNSGRFPAPMQRLAILAALENGSATSTGPRCRSKGNYWGMSQENQCYCSHNTSGSNSVQCSKLYMSWAKYIWKFASMHINSPGHWGPWVMPSLWEPVLAEARLIKIQRKAFSYLFISPFLPNGEKQYIA